MTTAAMVIKPGMFRSVPMAEYLAWPAVNNSTIGAAFRWNGEIDMARFKAALDSPPKPPTDSMLFGIFAHCGQLEPLQLLRRYAVMPAFENDEGNCTQKGERTNSKATTYYKAKVTAFAATNNGKQVVEQGEFDRMLAILESVKRNNSARRLFECEGDTEVSIVWEDSDTGILCKARIDKVSHGMQALPDFKTTADVTKFSASIWNYGYHRQQAFYADGYFALTGKVYEPWLVAAESESPHGVCAAPLSRSTIEKGRAQYKSVLSRYQACMESGEWPGTPSPGEWSLPAWAEDEVPVNIS